MRILLLTVFGIVGLADSIVGGQGLKKTDDSIRVATYNVSLNRRSAGELSKELATGNSKPAKAIAEVIQRVRPDVLLVNELDYDGGKSATLFLEKYLAVSQGDLASIEYPHRIALPVNTGVASGLDLDNNGRTGDPNDAFGFGYFPGQYGMAVYSMYPIDKESIRTFQHFLWKDMPAALWPKKKGGSPYYSAKAVEKFRLSSKSHWDLPIKIGGKTIHLLAAHPTPPVFDGAEDKNGRRNHDEIRMWLDYVSGKADYLYDDNGKKGGLDADAHFVVAGDLNADPNDGDSYPGAIAQLLNSPLFNRSFVPKSTGGQYWAESQGGVNPSHKGDAAADTGDFNDKRVGNMRIDYVLPSKNLKVANSGVFWPKPEQAGAKAVAVSDHRLVWIDITK